MSMGTGGASLSPITPAFGPPLVGGSVAGAATEGGAVRATGAGQSFPAMPVKEADLRPMRVVEQEMIDRALEITGGNVNRAAALLEISPSSVYRKRTRTRT